MLRNRIEAKSVNTYMEVISHICSKFNEKTIIAIDKSIKHLRKYKKTYNTVIVCFAIWLSPQIVHLGKVLISTFMYELHLLEVSVEANEFKMFIHQIGCQLVKYAALSVAMCSAISTMLKESYIRNRNKVFSRLGK